MPMELKPVVRKMALRKTRIGTVELHAGMLGDREVVAIVTGMGTKLARDGIEGVSTRQLANMLGIAGPSLYWHFHNKRELLDHMAEAMLAEAQPVPDPLIDEPDWRLWLAQAARIDSVGDWFQIGPFPSRC